MSTHSQLAQNQLHEPFHYVQEADPGAVGANKYWLKVSTGALKRRNGADSAWQQVSPGFASPLTTKGDLLGYNTGTTRVPVGANGQLLSANSAESLGLEWVNALTDVSTTKGDILARSSSALDRLSVGSNGYVLTADSAETLGVKWAVGAGGAPKISDFLLTSGDARNDEFSGGPTIDGKWTLVGTSPSVVDVNSSLAGNLHIERTGSASQLTVYYQAAASYPTTIYTRLTSTTTAANYARGGGLILLPASPTTASAAYYFGINWNGAARIAAMTYTSLSAFSAETYTSPAGVDASLVHNLMITILSATKFIAAWTPDDYIWYSSPILTSPFTIANSGVAMAPEGQTNLTANFAAFRAL